MTCTAVSDTICHLVNCQRHNLGCQTETLLALPKRLDSPQRPSFVESVVDPPNFAKGEYEKGLNLHCMLLANGLLHI